MQQEIILPKRIKSVRFSRSTRVTKQNILFSVHDEDDERHDSTSLWYSKSDYHRFRQDIFNDVALLSQLQSNNTLEEGTNTTMPCSWGIEHIIDPTLNAKRARSRTRVINAVLNEQKFQFRRELVQSGRQYTDPNILCTASQMYSMWAVSLCRERGECYSNSLIFRRAVFSIQTRQNCVQNIRMRSRRMHERV